MKCSESSSPLPRRPRPSHSPMSQERGTSSGVRSVGISMGTATTSGAALRQGLLLALEEPVHDESGEPGPGQAGNTKQNKEENLKCKYGHDAILTVSRSVVCL